MKINFEFQFSMRKNFFLQTCRAIKIIPGIIRQVTIFAWWHCSQTTRFDINTAECGLCINIRYINNLINSNKLGIMIRASSILKLPWINMRMRPVGWKSFACIVKQILQYDPNRHWSSSFPSKSGHGGCQCAESKLEIRFYLLLLDAHNNQYQQHFYLIEIGKICFLNCSWNLSDTSVFDTFFLL